MIFRSRQELRCIKSWTPLIQDSPCQSLNPLWIILSSRLLSGQRHWHMEPQVFWTDCGSVPRSNGINLRVRSLSAAGTQGDSVYARKEHRKTEDVEINVEIRMLRTGWEIDMGRKMMKDVERFECVIRAVVLFLVIWPSYSNCQGPAKLLEAAAYLCMGCPWCYWASWGTWTFLDWVAACARQCQAILPVHVRWCQNMHKRD